MRDFIYVTSASFSGSTLLTFLLNTHPKIATIGEMKGDSMDVRAYHCSCGAPIGDCGFWRRLVARMRERGVPFDLADVWTQSGFRIAGSMIANRILRHRYRAWPLEIARDAFLAVSPKCRRELRRINHVNAAFIDAVTELANKPIFLDSSKDPVRLKFLRRIQSFRIKVIYLVRDGRGVMNSNMKRLELSPLEAIREWVLAQQEIRFALRGVDPSHVATVRYEDLCREPDRTLAGLFRFLAVDPDAATRDFRAVEHHILGNAMRFDNSSEIVLDTRWMRDLTPDMLRLFDRVGGGLNQQLGYDAAPAETTALRAVEV